MTFVNKLKGAVTGGASLALALGLSSCSRDYTVGYVYSVSAGNATISAYAIDYQTGILNQINGSPFASTVSNPLKVVASPNNQAVYIIGGPNGSQGNAVEEALVGSDGKLYSTHTYNLTGSEGPGTSNLPTPLGATVDPSGKFLYVTFTYQLGYSSASPGPGGLTVFPINSDNSLGTALTVNVGSDPAGVVVAPPVCVATPVISSNPTCTVSTGGSGIYNSYVYVIDQENSLGKATVLGFAQNMTTGALTPLSGTATDVNLKTLQGASAGVRPSAIAVDPTSSYVYVTDEITNQIYGYQIARSTTGNLTALVSSPFAAGSLPLDIKVDPRGLFVYTANSNSGSVGAYTINTASGSLSAVAGSTFTAASGTNCVAIDPNLGQYLYASNFLAGSISGGQLNSHTGVLTALQNTPYPASSLPSCLVAVGNGPHAINVTTPSTGTSN